MSLLEVIAAVLLLLGSYLVLHTVIAADTWGTQAPPSAAEGEDEVPYRRAA